MDVNPSIFREYDIRGIVGDKFESKVVQEYEKWYGKFPGITISYEVAEHIGRAYGSRIRARGGKKVVVGHEHRPFGKELKQSFINGVRSTGCDVYDAHVSLTPIIYFATAYYDFDGGVNVTGSHNVYFYNGFKTMAKGVYPIYGEELQMMRKMIEKEEYVSDKQGGYKYFHVVQDYENYMLDKVRIKKKLKVVVDCGNGSAGIFAPKIFRKMGCEVIELYTEPDSTFPNHIPDPSDPFNMVDLSNIVKHEKADIGIGIDADGDRMGIVDENGNFELGDRILSAIVNSGKLNVRGKKVLFDVKCSNIVPNVIERKGGVPLMHRTGHAPIKETLREDSSIIFGAELSGHFYMIENYFKIDDGIFAAAYFMSLLEHPVSTYFNPLPITVSTQELKLPCSDESKFNVIESIKNSFGEHQINTIDGARISFSDSSWALIRASNTTPYISIRIEADTKDELLTIKGRVQAELSKHPEVGDSLNIHEVSSHTGRLGWV